MGTRADFYVGVGKEAEWIGSVAWGGYEWGERITDNDPDDITAANDEAAFRTAVKAMFEKRDDATPPEQGWPWPWDDSCTTDCAYCFSDGEVLAFSWGAPWSDDDAPAIEWPHMRASDSAPAGSARSGVMVFGR